ncbi:hypothetical protein SAMN06265365_10121 [Tistlia consotensis]|uniref:Uncharacterized protein n=1 Tax=Tistlia consotensis USBA 355 TaxID=560819 RepID=A0A1Y6B6F0_9PROT|nr:sel1 repeat family protein [Tistlia consotensis]SME87858.1 hypothetical protein SAMN05428998_10121 [Tistlia consotensis USBA 355]SNR24203.1 hypothetical protein SAMN06265365_10121 [Tistlia consotensis]
MDPVPRRVLSAAVLLAAAAGPAAAAPGPGGLVALCLEAPRLQAVEPCSRALAAEPGNLAVERRLAWGLLATYRETDAIEHFAAIAERRPDDLGAQVDLAAVLVGLRAYDAAEAPLRRALALAPENLETNRLASIYFAIREDYGAEHEAHRRLAAQGDLTAMFDLSEDFAQGRGVEPDQPRARRWLEAAAAGGHVLAMRTLSEKLRHGAFGMPPDPAGADYWLQQAEALSAR